MLKPRKPEPGDFLTPEVKKAFRKAEGAPTESDLTKGGKAQYAEAMADYEKVDAARTKELAAAKLGDRTSWGDIR